MPYTLTWHLESKVIYGTVFDSLTIEEAREASDEALKLLAEGDAPVHLVVDMQKMKDVPLSWHAITNMLSYLGHKNMGWLLMIDGKPVTDAMVNAVGKLLRFKYKYVLNVDEAMQFLHAEDKSLINYDKA